MTNEQQLRVAKYYTSKRVNNSLLKMLDKAPGLVKYKMDYPDDKDESKRHFRVGGAIDTILTDNANFKNLFTAIRTKRPSTAMEKFINALPSYGNDVSPEELKIAQKASELKSTGAKLLKKVEDDDDMTKFWKVVSLARDREQEILTPDEMDEVNHCKTRLYENPATKRYFVSDDIQTQLLHQVPLYFTYKLDDGTETQCKALLDGVMIDHKNKIIQPFDLKTIGRSVTAFPFDMVKLGYYLQAAFYKLGLEQCRDGYGDDYPPELMQPFKDGYEIKPLKFVVTETNVKSYAAARVFPMTEEDSLCGLHGGTLVSGRKVKGIIDLLKDLNWHRTNNKWKMSRHLYENNGEEQIQLFLKSNLTIKQ